MIKVLLCRFQLSLGPFKMLTVARCSQTGLFSHLSKQVHEGHLFFKIAKFYPDFRNGSKILEEVFCFLDNQFELVAENSNFYKENTSDQQSMC